MKASELIPFSDLLLEALVFAKRRVLSQNISDLKFLSMINLKRIMNKEIRYSRICHSRDYS